MLKFAPTNHVKSYAITDLLDIDAAHRMQAIMQCSQAWAYYTQFMFQDDQAYRLSPRLPVTRKTIYVPTVNDLIQLAQQIDQAHTHGVVHGDIHPKNIYRVNGQVVLTDWEPSLLQRVQGKPSWMYTVPFIATQDHALGTLSRLTDFLCFIRFAIDSAHIVYQAA